ncbi:MAG: addiction module protein [Desulfobulbaceae bacterium]|nr:addiction module protein [Desulfobulbaceae bacterium]
MRPDEIKNEIERMPLSQKLLLVEDIWDSIAADNSDIPISEWQVMELDKRYKNYSEGKLGLHDWQTVHNELRNKHK